MQINRVYTFTNKFLLTPLREGRQVAVSKLMRKTLLFLLTPLREGRPAARRDHDRRVPHFYSRPCGRGDR